MRPTVKRLAALVLILAAVSCVSSALAAEAPRTEAERASTSAAKAPRAVVLGEGKVRQLSWRISAYRRKNGSPERPCVIEQNLISGGYAQGVECGPPAPKGEDALFTQFSASFEQGPGGPKVGATSMALLFAEDIVKVRLDLRPGPSQTRKTRLLNTKQANKSGLDPFRYLALGVARDVCVARIVGFDADGVQVLDQPRSACKSSGSIGSSPG